MAIGLGIAVLLGVGSAVAYDQFGNNDEISPTPYNPPAITIPSENTTDNTTIITENQTSEKPPLSLEEKLADRLAPNGPLSSADIERYTFDAYDIAYEANQTDNEEMYDLAKESLGRVIVSVVNSIFEDKNLGYKHYSALEKTAYRYLYGEESLRSEKEFMDGIDVLIRDGKRLCKKRLKRGLLHSFTRWQWSVA